MQPFGLRRFPDDVMDAIADYCVYSVNTYYNSEIKLKKQIKTYMIYKLQVIRTEKKVWKHFLDYLDPYNYCDAFVSYKKKVHYCIT